MPQLAGPPEPVVDGTAEHTPLHLHHLGWVVRSIPKSLPSFQTPLCLEDLGIEDHGWVHVAFLGTGCSMIELLEPRNDDSDLAEYLRTHGEGIHHIALGVPDVAEALSFAKQRGVRVIDDEPRLGARSSLIAFVDPERPDGVLFEFVQDAPGVSRLGHPGSGRRPD